MSSAIDGLAHDLARQRDFLRERSPAYAALLEHLMDALPRGLSAELARVWQNRTFLAWYDRPLLLLASLRYEALCEGAAHPLWSSIGDAHAAATQPTADELRRALDSKHTRGWQSLARRTVQTNETTRAIAWLLPAHLWAEVDATTPLHLVDVGTSAGLNLVADGLPMDWTDEVGQLLELSPLPPVVTRLGLDLSPLDVADDDAVRWLRACVWPSDRARLQRLDQAIVAFRNARLRETGAPQLEARAIETVPARAADIGRTERLLVLQTILRDYVPPPAWDEYQRGLCALLIERDPGSALWIELEVEPEGESVERAAVLRAHVATRQASIESIVLARTHPHPTKLFMDHDAVRKLRGALAAPAAAF